MGPTWFSEVLPVVVQVMNRIQEYRWWRCWWAFQSFNLVGFVVSWTLGRPAIVQTLSPMSFALQVDAISSTGDAWTDSAPTMIAITAVTSFSSCRFICLGLDVITTGFLSTIDWMEHTGGHWPVMSESWRCSLRCAHLGWNDLTTHWSGSTPAVILVTAPQKHCYKRGLQVMSARGSTAMPEILRHCKRGWAKIEKLFQCSC